MRSTFRLTVIVFIVAAALIGGRSVFDTAVGAQASRAPKYKLEPTFPKIPYGWQFGSVSNVAVDSRDHIWLLQRPREVPDQFGAHRAPPVLEFDADGNFITAWGGPARPDADGKLPYEWTANEHGIHVDYQGNVWVAGN